MLEGLRLAGDDSSSSLRCEPGTITVLLGRNRSGKSALCRWLAGLTASVSGQVRLGATDLGPLPPAQRPVALVHQAFVNYPHWTVAENIASPLRAQGVAAAERRERVAAIASALGLEALLDRLPEQLSGGQQQRLAIGRALAKDARVLVLDEPFVNLDYKLREVLEQELQRLARERGLILLYASSDPREGFALGDQVVLLDQDRVLQHGAPTAVYARPRSFTAATLMSEQALNAVDGAGAWLRPEHLALEPQGEDSLRFVMRVAGTETNGNQTFVHGPCESATTLPDGRAEDQTLWHARLRGMPAVTVGEALTLHARPADVLRFAER
ncbi:MAG: ABC transporter ATP-binding protein [Pseudomonadota bacterium]